ncbi:hypothetical protein [Epilithonimonas xixisoli]|uniref:Uncharacterized protein n=1 Tax=Epilithonimonas xixisoli TaxID=1476462 RepID=A0A4R8I8Y5_9FLAO|nr:hypothetical protein [Epilithonimonas xixisoli]TDX86447.1 hypothetical protein B0I22_0572 [Epilithonimonas xixisoli]
MNIEKLKKLETDSAIINKYIGVSSFGHNKIIYLPLVIGIGLLMFVAMAFISDLTETIGMTMLIVAVALLCFGLVKIIADSTKKKLLATTSIAPISIAKIIVGNATENVFYSIYTSDENRHDENFIDRIAEKIDIATENPQTAMDKEIAILFRPDFIKPNEFAKKLPLAFTENIVVWRKQVSFVASPKTVNEKIREEGDKFPMVTIIPENARFLSDYYTD